jgi:hypothetical protein
VNGVQRRRRKGAPVGCLSLQDAAQLVGVSTEWIRRLVRSGELAGQQEPYGDNGRLRYWVRAASVRAYFDLPVSGSDTADLVTGNPSELTDRERELLVDSRDRWRQEALRHRQANSYLTAAVDAMVEATRCRDSAQELVEKAMEKYRDASAKERDAIELYNSAIREFAAPADIRET